jgi:hypothetical protein
MEYKFILSIFVLFMLSLSLISAMDWDNRPKLTASNLSKYPIVEVDNWLGLGAKLSKYEIIEHTEYCGELGWTVYNVTLYSPQILIDDISFLKLNNGWKPTSIKDYKILMKVGEVKRIRLEPSCQEIIYKNESKGQNCTYKEVEYSEPQWSKYSGDKLEGNYIIKVEGRKNNPNDVIDFQPTFQGVKITDHAVWNSTFAIGLIHSWSFSESSGTTSIDGVGTVLFNQRNVTLMDNTEFRPGKNGNGLFFDGNDRANVTGYADYPNATSDFAISFWVNWSSAGTPFTNDVTYPSLAGSIGMDEGGAALAGYTGTATHSSARVNTDSLWHNVVFMKNATGVFIYNDATYYSVGAMGSVTPSSLWFGARKGGSVGITGMLDEFYIWNRSLSQSEILSLYDSGTGTFYSNIDAIPPYFITIAIPQTINYTQGFKAYFVGTDVTEFGTYKINWTSLFAINSTGGLYNSTPNIAAGFYQINVTINDTAGNTNSTIWNLTVNQITPTITKLLNGLDSNLTINFPQQINATGSTNAGTLIIYFNGSTLTSGLNYSLPAGLNRIDYNVTGNTNYTNTSLSLFANVSKSTPQGNTSGTTPIIYGTASNVQGSESNTGDSDVTYRLYRNNAIVSNPDTEVLGVGTYNYIYNATSGQNYTSNSSIGTFTLIVNTSTSSTTLTISPVSPIVYPATSNFSCSGGGVKLYVNGIDDTINNGLNTIRGVYPNYNVTCIIEANVNTTGSSANGSYTITKGTLGGSLLSSNGWNILNGTSTNISISESNPGDSDVTYTIYCNGENIGTGDTIIPLLVNNPCILTSSSGANYSANSSIDTKILTTYSNLGEILITKDFLNDYSCGSGFSNCSKANDGYWDSYAITGYEENYYENYTIPLGTTNAVIVFSAYFEFCSSSNKLVRYWNYTLNDWTTLQNQPDSYGIVQNFTASIPSDGLIKKIRLKYYIGAGEGGGKLYESKLNYYVNTNLNYMASLKDTFVNSDSQSTNYGNLTYMGVDSAAPTILMSYFSLDISKIKTNNNLSSAILHLTVSSISHDANMIIGLRRISDLNWLEYGMNYTNQPCSNSNCSDFIDLVYINDSFTDVYFDLTDLINSNLNINDSISLAIFGNTSNPYYVSFNTREDSTETPMLHILLTNGILENSISYTSPIIEGQANTITGNFTLGIIPTSIILNYNGLNYTPSISIVGKDYILTSNVVSPLIGSAENISLYYTFLVNGSYYNSSIRNQTITNVDLSINCTGNYNFLNITNYDEETLSLMNGTVEYTLGLQNNNNEISSISGNSTGTILEFCTNQNLTGQYLNYNLQIRYYSSGYLCETYNIQATSTSNLPLDIPLYFLNNSIGTQFKINYVDFNYLTYPGAIIQIQRQDLYNNTYRLVEIPKIDNQGQSIGSFNTNNIRYKIIIVNNGVILDTFNDIFPTCQNIVLGTCELNIRGTKSTSSSTTGDFTYTLVKTNNSIILTYVIPSGTPRNIQFLTTQNSRFLNNVSNCDSSIYASGGTITCGYNETIGDSIVNTQIINSDGSHLYGNVQISEDLSGFYLLNNYFIGFILLLTLALMFISSGAILVIVSVVGIIFLGLIFLIRGMDVFTLTGSLGWIVVGAVLIIYKISKKEETS